MEELEYAQLVQSSVISAIMRSSGLLACCLLVSCLSSVVGSVASRQDYSTTNDPHLFVRDGDVLVGGMFSLFLDVDGQSQAGGGRPRLCGPKLQAEYVYQYAHPLVYVLRDVHGLNLTAYGRNMSVGYVIADTCNSRYAATNASYQLGAVARRLDLCRSSNAGAVCDARQRTRPVGGALLAIGPAESSMVAAASDVLTILRVPHISPSATSNDFTQERNPLFFRTSPPDRYQAEAMADLLSYFGWNQVIALSSDDFSYGRSGLRLFRQAAAARNICVAYHQAFGKNDNDLIEEIVDVLYNNQEARVVVMFSGSSSARSLFGAIVKRKKELTSESERQRFDKIWIGSDAWGGNQVLTLKEGWDEVLQMAIVLMPGIPRTSVGPLLESLVSGYVEHIANMNTEHVRTQTDDPWLCGMWEVFLNCSDVCVNDHYLRGDVGEEPCGTRSMQGRQAVLLQDLFYGRSTLMSTEIAFQALESIWREVVREDDSLSDRDLLEKFFERATMEKLLDTLHHLVMQCSETSLCSVPVFGSGSETLPSYMFYFIKAAQKQYIEMGHWASDSSAPVDRCARTLDINHSAMIWPTGVATTECTYSKCGKNVAFSAPTSTCQPSCGNGLFAKLKEAPPCSCWECYRCSDQSKIDAKTALSLCPADDFSLNTQANCSKEVVYFGKNLTGGGSLAMLLFSTFAILLIAFTLVVFHLKRRTKVVRASDLILSVLLLAAMAGGYGSAMVLSVKPTNEQCYVGQLLLTPFYILTTATLMIKTSRLARLARAAGRMRLSNSWSMNHGAQIFFIFLLTLFGSALDATTLLVWAPETDLVDIGGNKLNLICSFKVGPRLAVDIYITILIVLTSLFAFHTRKLPSSYQEARFIFIASFSSFVVWVVISFAYYLTESESRPLFGGLRLRAYLFMVWLSVFAPKLFRLLTTPRARRSVRSFFNRSARSITFARASTRPNL